MPTRTEKIAGLIYQHLVKDLSESDKKKLVLWIEESRENELFFQHITNPITLKKELIEFYNPPRDLNFEKLLEKIKHIPVKPEKRSLWIPYMAAAALVTVLLSIVFFFLKTKTMNSKTIPSYAKDIREDVLPGGDRAFLILDDGRTIALDTSANMLIPAQGNTSIAKSGRSELSYSEIKTPGSKENGLYNTITTPKGGQYRVVLPDGTKVWLNSASSLRFPTSFFHKKRIVTIHGEAYFEVAKNDKMPFTVETGKMQIEVMGTHFNVMAYADEGSVKTTLLEGKVQVKNESRITLLKPGQQCLMTPDGNLLINSVIGLQETVAWKNGMFSFKKDSLETIMRQVARWYNVEVTFKEPIPGHFVATISRDVPVSKLLEILELAGGVHFTIKGNVIIVSKN